MNLLVNLGVSLLLGSVLGWVYFQVLWSAVQRMTQRQHQGMGFVPSMAARFALMLAGFTIAVRWGDWPALGAALAGFLLARAVIVRRVRAATPLPEDKS